MNHRIDPTEMMAIQLETLFLHDQNGRLAGINSEDDIAAPRFFFGSTEKGNLWRFRCDLPAVYTENYIRLFFEYENVDLRVS